MKTGLSYIYLLLRSSNQRTATRIDTRVDNSTPAGATIERAEFAVKDVSEG
jgi:hypothetical protein